jgi:hypothetical protein
VIALSEKQGQDTPAEKMAGEVEQGPKSYVDEQRAYFGLTSVSEEKPPVPREVGLFTHIGPWTDPFAPIASRNPPVAEESTAEPSAEE